MVTDKGDDGNEIDARRGSAEKKAIVARDRFPSAAISRGDNRHFMV